MVAAKVAVLLGMAGAAAGQVGMGDVCRHGDAKEGGCLADGWGCVGEEVEFSPYQLKVDQWDSVNKKSLRYGAMQSYALGAAPGTWQMYLHGPMLRPSERTSALSIPPVYVSGTWVNTIYRFENFSLPAPGKPLKARQKVVGHALAPSTTWPVEDSTGRLNGLLVAEGQPWWLNRLPLPTEVYKGGVEFLPVNDQEKCEYLFPDEGLHRMLGQVVNTVDCHKGTNVCFFTVWKFYDDQRPVWSNMSEKVAPDCLYYCMADQLEDRPSCKKVGVVTDEHGQPVCHRDGRGAVHGMTIGKTDSSDQNQFDILLVFTGGATFTGGDSSMQKVRVSIGGGAKAEDKTLTVMKSEDFATDLFSKLPAKGQDAGGDHAWVDETGKYIWISAFRESAAGIHMVTYEDGGRLIYSVRGIDSYLPNQYAYSAGIHGVGTLGKAGSYLAVATSACHAVKACAPIPWNFPIPRSMWASGIFFIIDLASLSHNMTEEEQAASILV
eukprot:gb/GFBE01025881.1/.p1 GENE.gb/GFBE01025881.1/~~gb/GFBE01025881.1/.p1  ORF type:complete len:493 (+),score=103.56 gb/GFBE01025881.1/:1-1479(+)